MTSFKGAASSLGAQWASVLTIEGLGDSAGLFYFCSNVPDFAASNANWRPWIRSEAWPDVISETVNVMGGLPDAGNIAVNLVDVDNTLTSEWRTERGPITLASAAITKDSTSVTVIDASNIAAGDVIYMGTEAMKVGGKSSNDLTSLTRGYLGTDAASHAANEEVYLSTPYLRGRRIKLYVSPIDAGSVADLYLFGTYHVDSFSLSEDLNSYVLQGKSALKYLDRLVSHEPLNPEFVINVNQNDAGRLFLSHPGTWDQWSAGAAFMRFDDEIVTVKPSSLAPVIVDVMKRGQLGTQAGKADLKAQDSGQWILAADEDSSGPGAFRFISGGDWSQLSAGDKASTDRNSYLWKRSAHWIDILLCIFTSSAGDDGLELVNGHDTYGNWSSLPVGYGLGVPASVIDFESFVKLKNETPDFKFKAFHLDSESKPVKKCISEQILKPIGAYITTETGSIALRMPKIPLLNSTLTAWDSSVVLSKNAGDRRRLSDLQISQDVSKVATTVSFEVLNQSGGKAVHTFKDSSFEGWSVGRTYYAKEESPLEFKVPGIINEGSQAFIKRLGMRKLFRFRRPMWSLRLGTGYDQAGIVPGDLVGLSHDDLPDTETGLRGWSNVACEIVGREVALDEKGARISFDLVAFTEARIGRVSASAYIVGTSGPDGDGNYALDLASNLYTDAASLGDLPTDDAGGFRALDVVTLCNADGSDGASTVTQAVVSVSGDRVVIDGNFSGSLAAGKVLVFSDRASAVSAQYDYFVYFAATTDTPPNIGASTDKPWRYGE